MPITIIIKGEKPKGETRSKIDERLRKDGLGTTFHNEEQRDRCEYAERKAKKVKGADRGFLPTRIIDEIE